MILSIYNYKTFKIIQALEDATTNDAPNEHLGVVHCAVLRGGALQSQELEVIVVIVWWEGAGRVDCVVSLLILLGLREGT
jgi:hypothetical protein